MDHLVGGGQQRFRDGEAERLGGFEVDDEFELARLHGRQIGGFFALENTPDIANVLSPNLAGVRPLAP